MKILGTINALYNNYTNPRYCRNQNFGRITHINRDEFVRNDSVQSCNGKEKDFWTKKIEFDAAQISSKAEKNSKRCFNTLFDLRFEGIDFQNNVKGELNEILELYETNSPYTKDGRTVIISDNSLTEYSSDGEIQKRAIFIDGGTKIIKKKKLFGTGYREKTIKVGPQISKMIEFKPDGSCNVYTDGYYTQGYREYQDGSCVYDKQILIDSQTDNKVSGKRFYSKGYKMDSNGNEFWEISTFLDSSANSGGFENIKSFKYKEIQFSDKYETVQIFYEFGGSRYGNTCEGYMQNYAKSINGTQSCDEEVVTMIPSGLKSYKEKYIKDSNGLESWKRYITRNNECSNWKDIPTPYARTA